MTENHPGAGRYPRVVKAMSETPWAIEQATFDAIREMVALRVAGGKFTEAEIEARIGGQPAEKPALTMNGPVAILPIQGVIAPRADLFTAISGGTTVESLRSQLGAALADEKVSSIVLDVNSPGGSVDMLTELAAEIRSARDVKPVVAVANGKAASAAYWLASQAGEVFVTPSGSVGSIGVVAAHEDISGQEEQDGVKTTLVSAGKFKTSGNPFGPLDEEGLAVIQERVDDAYSMFVGDVAAGRGTTVDLVKAGYGEGKMLAAPKAVAAGMVDGVATIDEVVARLTAEAPVEPDGSAIRNAQMSVTEQTDAVREMAANLLDRFASLAEVKRGHLTVSKREHLSACTGALRDVTAQLEELLAGTNPDKPDDDAFGEFAALIVRTTRGAAL